MPLAFLYVHTVIITHRFYGTSLFFGVCPPGETISVSPHDVFHCQIRMFGIKMRIDHWKNRAVDTTPDINTTEEHLQPEGLFPFAGNPRQPMPKGIAFDLHEYIQLVDWTGRQIRDDKRGSIASDALPIIQRINISTDQWLNLCTHFESRFKGLVGSDNSLTNLYSRFGLLRRPNHFYSKLFLGS